MSFSVVITNYNYAQFLGEAVASALAQTRAPLEVIVVDDGSTDGSAEVLARLEQRDARVRVLRKANGGQLSAFIEGVRAAQGEFVALLDADDVWTEGYLAAVAAVYAREPAVDFVFTNLELFGDRHGLKSRDTRDRDLGYSTLMGAYEPHFQGAATSAITLRRALALRLLDLPPETVAAWRTRADDVLVFGADTLGARKYFLAQPLVRYRAHGGNAYLGRGREHDTKYQYALRKARLIEHFRAKAGIGTAQLAFARQEFRTKRNPTWRLVGIYWRLVGRSELSWADALVSRLAILGHYLRARLS